MTNKEIGIELMNLIQDKMKEADLNIQDTLDTVCGAFITLLEVWTEAAGEDPYEVVPENLRDMADQIEELGLSNAVDQLKKRCRPWG